MTTSAATTATPYRYTKDPRGLTRFLIGATWVVLGLEVASVLSNFAELQLLRGHFTPQQAAANDERQGIVALFYLVGFIVWGITYLRWLHRTNVNCRGFGTNDMRFTPAWSVAWHFIPFMNLVRPFQVKREIWLSAHHPGNDRWMLQQASPLIGIWWALWLLSGSLGTASFRLSMRAETLDQIQVATSVSLAASLVGIPLCLVFIVLIKSISAAHERLVERGATS